MTRPALIAAQQAVEAAAALLLHVTEQGGLGEVDVVEKLAEALALAVDIHLEIEVEPCDTEYRQSLTELRDTADRFIEAWSG